MDALLNPQTGGYVVNQSAQSIENELYIRTNCAAKSI